MYPEGHLPGDFQTKAAGHRILKYAADKIGLDGRGCERLKNAIIFSRISSDHSVPRRGTVLSGRSDSRRSR